LYLHFALRVKKNACQILTDLGGFMLEVHQCRMMNWHALAWNIDKIYKSCLFFLFNGSRFDPLWSYDIKFQWFLIFWKTLIMIAVLNIRKTVILCILWQLFNYLHACLFKRYKSLLLSTYMFYVGSHYISMRSQRFDNMLDISAFETLSTANRKNLWTWLKVRS
jgi:hypothetical protein